MKRICLLLLLSLFVSACADTTVSTLNTELMPGLTMPQVEERLGKPSGVEFDRGIVAWRYSAWKPFVGNVPYYLIFQPNQDGDMILVSSQANMHEYWANQQMWMGVTNNLQQQGTALHLQQSQHAIQSSINTPRHVSGHPMYLRPDGSLGYTEDYQTLITQDGIVYVDKW